MKNLTEEQKNQSIEELTKSIFTKEFVNEINNASDFDDLVSQTKAYRKFYSLMKVDMIGTEKQKAWAEKIRDIKITEVANNIVKTLIFCKLGISDIDFNRYANSTINNMKKSNASFWIENRF